MSSLAHSALLIIDMQVGLLHGPEAPHAGPQLLANINRLADAAHSAGIPVLAVRHTGPAGSPIAAGSPLWQLLPELAVTAADLVFDKQRPSAFHGTALDSWLQQRGVQTLLVTGMKTQYCIDTTCRAAADLGYSVVLVSDAHTCMDTPQLVAPQIIAHHNATLAGPFVRLMSSDEVCEALTHTLQPG
ncbi:TPA: cysteine hydrolase [Aeromonas dhakensis]|uniref:cysteine hydrolase family protein n=1 Tax=Aeromonas dhakensis TaxID=196024 RepID=UPI002447765A|nr:cysteine hydrolase family protein [Aeromonas dhakensis]MDH0177484.1 cysteine hydrolase [Aeromonas dhakensis]HDX8355381.1 cysteine hydrolase [Aeromonas dhakensis]